MEFRRKYKGSASFLTGRSAASAPLADTAQSFEAEQSFSDIDVLAMIQRLGSPTPQEVEEALSAAEIAQAIEALIGEGFVEQDKEQKQQLRLTAQGELALRYNRIAKG